MSDDLETREDSLVLRLPSSTQSVSAFHSLLRTTQAAAREAAQTTPEGAAAFIASPSPQLVFQIVDAGPTGLVIEFRFSDPSTGHAPHPVSGPAFAAFMDGLSSVIKASPMRTLWGSVPTRPTRPTRTEEAARRPGHEPGPLDERMEQVISELERLGDVELQLGERRIHLTRGGVQITP